MAASVCSKCSAHDATTDGMGGGGVRMRRSKRMESDLQTTSAFIRDLGEARIKHMEEGILTVVSRGMLVCTSVSYCSEQIFKNKTLCRTHKTARNEAQSLCSIVARSTLHVVMWSSCARPGKRIRTWPKSRVAVFSQTDPVSTVVHSCSSHELDSVPSGIHIHAP
ncbi:hypothetical protein CAOG_009394 [Capsaspora owczarzaki ATCC 30864]|uniref:Uncharacterized protein n=1 Tax=Capsaspora owczarzaki (strain ATCC 30864) TaxID=595528 RepID=A0A0D2U3K2_CAPO3|nr:hypothetical protein CAOG_009394 [Capsaspora owczarzaki ATCC 30864]